MEIILDNDILWNAHLDRLLNPWVLRSRGVMCGTTTPVCNTGKGFDLPIIIPLHTWSRFQAFFRIRTMLTAV